MLIATEAHERRERAAYWRAGLVAAAIVNAHKTKGSPVKPEDFVPKRRRRRLQTPEQMAARLKAMTLMMGGEVRDGQ